ncbi:uncharacterized protein LOC142488153 [Ascaphus truei]|uniref:uncharacterized protein LOC142488153 n=1 Tax=Ascaphus truei TaxID=8439 RepID=UPI003F5AB9A9
MWDTIVIGVNACGNHVRDKRNCHKRFDDIRSKLKKKIQHQRVHATGTGGGPTPQRLILSPLEELLRAKLLPVVVEGLPGDRDIGIYPSQFPPVAPEGHVSPETEQVSSPGSASSTHLEEHDEEDYDDDDDDDAAAAIDTQIQASDHEEVPIETVLPPNRPANTTYDAIVASEGKIVEAENRRHSDLMTVLERMIALQEETVSQLAHLHRVFIEVPKQLQKINTSFEALVVQQTQANYLRMTNVSQFNINTSQAGSVHAGQFSPHSSDLHSPGPNVTGQVADIAVQVPDDILPLPSVQIQQLTPTKEATKTKQDTHETDQPSLVQCLQTCSHVSVGTSPVREQSLPKRPVGESLPKSPVGESLPKSPVGESLPKSPVGESLPKSPVGESLATSPVGEQSLPKSPVGESLPKSPVGESLPKSPVGESLATSPAREVPEATQSGSVVAKEPRQKAATSRTPFGDKWMSACEQAFIGLKKSLTKAPVFAYADHEKPYILHMDTRFNGLGAVLHQKYPAGLRPVAYWAVVDKLYDYLQRVSFEVRTDNNSLTYILTSTKLDATGHRWLVTLSNCQFTLKYKPGSLNIGADALLCPKTGTECNPG